jgi:hypothetical protein
MMSASQIIATPLTTASEFGPAISDLLAWLEARDYSGHEPYDLLNSPYLRWAHRQPFATFFIQAGKRVGGLKLRQALRVASSHNPKALALILSAYCDLACCGIHCEPAAHRVKELLGSLRSPDETDFCWGYDWFYVSLRGARLPAFSPNSVCTAFGAHALLDYAETFCDAASRQRAFSAADWCIRRLQRSDDKDHGVCFSYTPYDRTRIYNNSALVGALLARVDRLQGLRQYETTARRVMQFLANGQASDGSWTYGQSRMQGWIDSFHSAYNIVALLGYQRYSRDRRFANTLVSGYDFYRRHFSLEDGTPRYFHNRTYPIDIHACAQAILTFCAFADTDPGALGLAVKIARWTIANLRNPDGSFGYQLHRVRQDRTPYVRWGQAWMLHALARLQHTMCSPGLPNDAHLD